MLFCNVIHMVLVKKKVLEGMAIPISTKWFGKNKTIRGFILLPLLSGGLVLLGSMFFGPFKSSIGIDFILGYLMGVVYLLAELPNSFVKRRLGIPTGSHSTKYRIVQIIVDRLDSLIGIFIFYYFVYYTPISDLMILFVLATGISLGASVILYSLKIKKSI